VYRPFEGYYFDMHNKRRRLPLPRPAVREKEITNEYAPWDLGPVERSLWSGVAAMEGASL